MERIEFNCVIEANPEIMEKAYITHLIYSFIRELCELAECKLDLEIKE